MMRWELNQRCAHKFLVEPSYALFKHQGMFCLMQRNYSGCWCGYAAIEPSHPLYGKHYHDKVLVPDINNIKYNGNVIGLFTLRSEAELGILPIDMAIEVHCGLTFAKPHAPGIYNKELGDLWWFGFDCSHSGDLHPYKCIFGDPHLDRENEQDVYRDYEFTHAQVIRLADQLAAFLPTPQKEEKQV